MLKMGLFIVEDRKLKRRD